MTIMVSIIIRLELLLSSFFRHPFVSQTTERDPRERERET